MDFQPTPATSPGKLKKPASKQAMSSSRKYPPVAWFWATRQSAPQPRRQNTQTRLQSTYSTRSVLVGMIQRLDVETFFGDGGPAVLTGGAEVPKLRGARSIASKSAAHPNNRDGRRRGKVSWLSAVFATSIGGVDRTVPSFKRQFLNPSHGHSKSMAEGSKSKTLQDVARRFS
jgi:hypothetical protein